MKVGSAAASLVLQHNPPSTWAGNFIIYQVLNVLMSRKAVIKRWLSLDGAVQFISQRLMAQR